MSRCSSWRVRSRVTPNFAANSASVIGSSLRRRCRNIFGVSVLQRGFEDLKFRLENLTELGLLDAAVGAQPGHVVQQIANRVALGASALTGMYAAISPPAKRSSMEMISLS